MKVGYIKTNLGRWKMVIQNTSKYQPHQGAKECARRIRQGIANG